MNNDKNSLISLQENSAEVPPVILSKVGTEVEEPEFESVKDWNERKDWFFTLWNWNGTAQNLEEWLKEKDARYYIFQKELGENSKKAHWQGYVEFKTKRKFTAVQGYFCKRCPFNKSKKNNEIQAPKNKYKCINYCKKEKTRIEGPFEFGEKISQGQRTDIENVINKIKEDGKISNEIKQSSLYVQYHRGFKEVEKSILEEKSDKNNENEIKNIILDLHQQLWEKALITQDNRKILWVWDESGGSGKTTFCKYMKNKHDASILQNGKSRDLLEAYNYEKIVVINLVRSEDEFVNYKLIESLKDGIIFKQKYESSIKCIGSVKVGIFANFEPIIEKMSSDRWTLLKIDDTGKMTKIKIEDITTKRKINVDADLLKEFDL